MKQQYRDNMKKDKLDKMFVVGFIHLNIMCIYSITNNTIGLWINVAILFFLFATLLIKNTE